VKLTLALARQLSALALGCVQREFPCNPAHVMRAAEDVGRPRALHPAFYGCFDWHSAVHGHWLLAHLLRRHPELSGLRKVLDSHLTAENLTTEAAYLRSHPYFERPYGWTWLLKLAHELNGWNDADAARWLAALQPLVDVIEERYTDWLPRQTYPIRAGVHSNTAFGLAFALDYARGAGRGAFETLLVERSLAYYANDRDCPAAWEPGGNDFLSPSLVEADLMRRVLPPQRFASWFSGFLPAIPRGLLEPAQASDRSDGQLVHLDGLNLSRAACFSSLSKVLARKDLREAAERHLAAGLDQVASGHYEGEHWLASFAAYALACALEEATITPAARSRDT
jgi:hypothetical protein